MKTARTLAVAAAALALAAPAAGSSPPLPDHPVTGRSVQPTWSYWHDAVSGNGLWKLRCYADAESTREDLCFVYGFTRAGAYAVLQGWFVLTRVQ